HSSVRQKITTHLEPMKPSNCWPGTCLNPSARQRVVPNFFFCVYRPVSNPKIKTEGRCAVSKHLPSVFCSLEPGTCGATGQITERYLRAGLQAREVIFMACCRNCVSRLAPPKWSGIR